MGDIPYLGYAFRSETKSLNKQNLIIFITPTIVKDNDFQPNMSDYLSTTPNDAELKNPVKFNQNSSWDTTKAPDWSSPASAKSSGKQ